MPRPPRRIPVNEPARPLTDNPFAALLGGDREASSQPAAPPPAPLAAPAAGAPGFQVARTRKGGLPIFVEKRPGGKVVTIVRNVDGDLASALAALKKRCGAGGAIRDGALEVQGDQRVKVEAYLLEAARIVAATP